MKINKSKIIIFLSICILIFLPCKYVYAEEFEKPEIVLTENAKIKTYNDTYLKQSNIPSYYNLSEHIDIKVKNQMNTSFCYAFSTSTVFETTYAKLNNTRTSPEISPRHIAYSLTRNFKNGAINEEGFSNSLSTGLDIRCGFAYFVRGSGPILESQMPFVNSMEQIDISEIQGKNVIFSVNDVISFPAINKDYDLEGKIIKYYDNDDTEYSKSDIDNIRNQIKEHIMRYGAVNSRTYMTTDYINQNILTNDRISYYNNYENESYGRIPNHAITIVGWDDNYSKNNFVVKPKNDGAYIVLNSYGSDWNSNGGYYYISYDDIYIEKRVYGIQSISNIDYDNIYQYDPLGPIDGGFVFNNPIYGANVFKKKTNNIEYLTKIGVFLENSINNIEIYVNNNGSNIDINNLVKVKEMNNLSAGFHTIKIDNSIVVGDVFSIAVKYEGDNKTTLPVELYNDSTSNIGESFFSNNGTFWIDMTQQLANANVCIKAFTTNERYIKNPNWKITNGTNYTIITGIESGTSISNILSSNNYNSGYIAKAYNKNGIQITSGTVTTGTIIKIYEGTNLLKEYYIVIYGDTNEDGNISSIDALTIVKNKLGTTKFLNDVVEEAGRVTLYTRNSKGIPSSIDALACIKHKLGIEIINQ